MHLPRLKPVQWVTHFAAWVPLALLVYDFFTNNLTVNPIQAAEIRTGDIAIVLLICSLACTPLNMLLRIPDLLKLRKPLGLYAYMYAAIHLLIFLGLDYGFDVQLLIQAIFEKPYVLYGLTGFIILSTLAITSFRWWMARLGKSWKRLHQLVYAINLLIVLHFGLSVKGDFFHLRGDVFRPVLAGVVVILLLILRLPLVRKTLAGKLRVVVPAFLRADPLKKKGFPG
jgi:sulfoxide reductase heme-binding subunit YedZ